MHGRIAEVRRDRVAAQSILDVAQTRGNEIEGFIPGYRFKSVADAAMRHTQTVRIGMQIDQRSCLRADRTARKRIVRVAAQIGDRSIFNRDFRPQIASQRLQARKYTPSRTVLIERAFARRRSGRR